MRYLLRLPRLLFAAYEFLIFVLCMLVLLPFVAISALFGKSVGGNMIYKLCYVWANILIFCGGVRQKTTYLARHDTGKRYVFVANHISYADIPVVIKAIGTKQKYRILGKYEMTKFPFFGFIYRNATVMVDRSSARKRAESVHQLKKVIAKDISIMIFPEGTFNETGRPLKKFFDGAFRIAIETKTPIKPILLLDTYKRLNYKSIFSMTPGRSRVVFLEEIPVEGLTIADVKMLKDKVYKAMEEKLLMYKADWIEA